MQWRTVDKIMRKYVKDVFVLQKRQETPPDEWGLEQVTYKDYTIKGVAFPITAEDLTFFPPGIVTEGDLHVTLLGKYTIDNEEIVAEPMDRILYGNGTFEIRIIRDIVDGDRVVLRTALCKRL